LGRLKYVVLPEVEEVRQVVAAMDGRQRWPRDLTESCIEKLDKAGLVLPAIADELSLSDSDVQDVLSSVRRKRLVGNPAAP
jgi:hypothetical protein